MIAFRALQFSNQTSFNQRSGGGEDDRVFGFEIQKLFQADRLGPLHFHVTASLGLDFDLERELVYGLQIPPRNWRSTHSPTPAKFVHQAKNSFADFE
jgi:hypothetical protein